MAGLVAHSHALGQDARGYVGKPVHEVLDELRSRGAPLVYSTSLVPPTLRVEREPQSVEPLEIAREVLAVHGLAIEQSGGAWLVVRGMSLAVAGRAATGTIALTVATEAWRAPGRRSRAARCAARPERRRRGRASGISVRRRGQAPTQRERARVSRPARVP